MPYESVLGDLDRPERNDAISQVTRKSALSIMTRVFKRNMTKHVKKWQCKAIPEKKVEHLTAEFSKQPEDFNYVAKLGAAECLSKMNSQMTFKAKIKAFRMITQHMYNKRSENDHDESLNERLDLLNRQNTLMEEIRAYKDENEALSYEV